MQWSGLQNAQMFERGTYFRPGGLYTLKVVNCLTKLTREAGEAFIAEFEVLQTSLPEAHPVGSKGSWFQKLVNREVAFGAIKEFLAAVYGYDLRSHKAAFEAQVLPQIEAFAAAATDGRNALKDRVVCLQTETTKTKKTGSDFTRHYWSPAPVVAVAAVR